MGDESECINRISMHDFVRVGDKIYFHANNYNGLYCFDLTQEQLQFLGSIPGEDLRKKNLYSAIFELNGKLYLAPMSGKEIAIYDIDKGEFEKLSLKYGSEKMFYKFTSILSDGQKIYFIPGRYHYVIIIDLESNQTTYVDCWYHQLELPEDYNEILVGKGAFISEKCLYMPLLKRNALVVMSTMDYSSRIQQVCTNTDNDGFMDMCMDNDKQYLWLLSETKPCIYKVKLDDRLKLCGKYDGVPKEFYQTGQYPFKNIICMNNKLYIISYQSNMSLEFLKESCELHLAGWEGNGEKNFRTEWNAKHYFAKKIEADTFLVANIEDLGLELISNGKCVKKLYLEDSYLQLRLSCFQGKILREQDGLNVKDFLNYLRQSK